MSDKKYPRILKSKSEHDNRIMLAFNKNECQCINSEAMSNYCGFDFDASENWIDITREYLTNTYGKCESQEHADYICKIAENAGFWVINDYSDVWSWFCFDGVHLEFYTEKVASNDGEKLIHLPLPPKENEMESQLPTATSETEMPKAKPDKPIYTKEMHERGLLPKVGMECLIVYKGGNTFEGEIKYISKDGFVYERENGTDSFNGSIDIVEFKPIPTIEDELNGLVADYFEVGKKHHCDQLVRELLSKYNITPKGE